MFKTFVSLLSGHASYIIFVVYSFEIWPLGLKSEYKLEGARKCGRGVQHTAL
jgi:hypothetical protein